MRARGIPLATTAEVQAKYAQEVADYEQTLSDLRKALEFTQVQLAQLMGCDQGSVSRIERRPDLLVSTLASYVEAMGGELELIATFGNRRVRLDLVDLAQSRVPRSRHASASH